MFEDFCESISTKVEGRILHWNGRNDINVHQALLLVKGGYLLGGFLIDFESGLVAAERDSRLLDVIPLSLAPIVAVRGVMGEVMAGFNNGDFLKPCFRSYLSNKNRIQGEGLKRDNYRLNNFYSNYKSAYENCEGDYNKLVDLKNRIEADLHEHSMCIIRETREFGG